MAEAHDGTGEGIALFLDWAGRTGELNANTAAALKGTCRSILSIDEAGESADVTSLDVEQLLDRWENLNRVKYSAGSLTTYRSRFRQTVAMYKAWLVKDPGWKAAGKASSGKGTSGAVKTGRPRKAVSPALVKTEEMSEQPPVSQTRLVAYEMPLRHDLLVRLTLPVDLNESDATRLAAFVHSLAFAAPASGAIAGASGGAG